MVVGGGARGGGGGCRRRSTTARRRRGADLARSPSTARPPAQDGYGAWDYGQYNLALVGAKTAWKYRTDAQSTKICVVDTGAREAGGAPRGVRRGARTC